MKGIARDEMKSFLRYGMLAVVITAIIALGGCSQKDETQVVAAEVNGDKILKQEVINIYNQQKAYYGITEETEANPEYKAELTEMKKGILEELINQRLIISKAKAAGYNITDEILDQAKNEFEETLASIAQQMKSMSVDDTKKEEDYLKEAGDYVDKQLQTMNMTSGEYINIMAQDLVIHKFTEDLLDDIEVTTDELRAYYDQELKMQKEESAYFAEGRVEIYKPAAVRVKHILIPLPEEIVDLYYHLIEEGKDTEAKEFLDNNLNMLKPETQEALNKAKKGENFEKLIEEYGQDPGMSSNKEGYIVSQNGEYIKAFEETAFKLKVGEVSDLVAAPYGYHIMKAYEKIPEKVFAFEDKKDEIRVFVEEQKKNAKWSSLLEEWMAKANIKKYENIL